MIKYVAATAFQIFSKLFTHYPTVLQFMNMQLKTLLKTHKINQSI
jgi:hypothetical protein